MDNCENRSSWNGITSCGSARFNDLGAGRFL